VFGLGLREILVIAFILVLLFGVKFWIRVGKRLGEWIKSRFKLD